MTLLVDALLIDYYILIVFVNYVNYKIQYNNNNTSIPYGSLEIAHYNTIYFIGITVYSVRILERWLTSLT